VSVTTSVPPSSIWRIADDHAFDSTTGQRAAPRRIPRGALGRCAFTSGDVRRWGHKCRNVEGRRQLWIVIGFLNHVGEYEAVAVARHRADKPRLPRIIVERAAECANGQAEGTVQDVGVGPDALNNFAAMNGFVSALYEQHEQIEVSRDQRDVTSIADQELSLRRECDVTEAISNHGFRMAMAAFSVVA